MSFNTQIGQYEEIIEKLEDLMTEVHKADLHFGLTDLQGQMQVQLRDWYNYTTGELLDLESRYVGERDE
jgi:hypothetical protein